MTSSPDHLEHDSVRFTDEGASEMDGRRALLFIPRSEITQVELVHGSGAERPLVAIILGITLLGAAAFSALWIVLVIIRQGNFQAKVIAAGVTFTIPAVWLLDLAMKKRWYLLVHTRRGKRKLLFKKNSDEVELQHFVRAVRSRYGL